jgi:hypothetical protein
MDLGILSKQLEQLPASGLVFELKGAGQKAGTTFAALSSVLSLCYLVFFLLLFIALIQLPLTLWLLIPLIMGLAFYSQLIFRKNILLSLPRSIKQLTFTELGWCYVRLNNDTVFKADISEHSILTEHIVILNLKPQTPETLLQKLNIFAQHSIILSRDRLNKEKFRELKRHLRFINFNKKPEDKPV